MRKFYLFISVIFIIGLPATAQDAQKTNSYGGNYENKNNIYGDVGFGVFNLAFVLRLNYERQIFQKNTIKLMGRTGIGYWSDWDVSGLEIPFTLQAIFFKSASHIELGIGASLYTSFSEDWSDFPVMVNFGYRFQKPDKGFLFRINAEYSGNHLIPMLSFGKSF